MKRIWIAALLVIAVALYIALPRTAYFVKPADNGLWRACITEYRWYGKATGCSSSISLSDAEWLTRTHGGTKDAHGSPSSDNNASGPQTRRCSDGFVELPSANGCVSTPFNATPFTESRER